MLEGHPANANKARMPHTVEEPMQLHYYSNADNGCALKSISFFYTELSETEMEETFVSNS